MRIKLTKPKMGIIIRDTASPELAQMFRTAWGQLVAGVPSNLWHPVRSKPLQSNTYLKKNWYWPIDRWSAISAASQAGVFVRVVKGRTRKQYKEHLDHIQRAWESAV